MKNTIDMIYKYLGLFAIICTIGNHTVIDVYGILNEHTQYVHPCVFEKTFLKGLCNNQLLYYPEKDLWWHMENCDTTIHNCFP